MATPQTALRAQISGIEDYFPERILTNQELSQMVDTNNEWIIERTGIRERRLGDKHETTSFMGIAASEKLLKKLNISPLEIDLILCATITPDHPFPATACIIQNKLGATNAYAYDINAACSGFLYALDTATAFIESKKAKKVLVIAAEKMSAVLDFKDRNTCILFGDGGSASLIEASSDSRGIIDSILRTDGSGCESLFSPSGGSKSPASHETVDRREHYIRQDGKVVFKRAVKDMADISAEILKKNNLTGSDIKLFVPHQANIRIIEAARDRIGLPAEKVAINLDRFGNTTAATIPTALLDAERKGQVKKGDLVLLASFGAGFTWGATLLRY